MTTRSATTKIASKTAKHLAPQRVKELTGAAKAAVDTVSKGQKSPTAALKKIGERVLGNKGKGATNNKVKVTNIIEEVDIGAPRRLVYDQWTQFQDFPSFTKKVQRTEQVAAEKVEWKAKIFWSTRTWESTIVEQVPDERIVWRSKGEKGHVDGAVTFHELSPDLTRVLLVLEYHPQGLFEKTGNLWRAQGRRVRLELKHFRRHVMTQTLLAKSDDVEGWRGEIQDSEVVTTHEDAVAGEKKQRGGGTRKRRESSGSKSSSGSSGSSGSSRAKRSSGSRRSSGNSSGNSSGSSSGSSSGKQSSRAGGSSSSRRSSDAEAE